MVDIKEVKSIKKAPFTLMYASISAILAFIVAILVVLVFGIITAIIPQLSLVSGLIAGFGFALIVIYPIAAFIINVSMAFITALIYNLLAPRVGGVKLGLEGDEVKELPVIAYALIMSLVSTVWAFLIGLLLAAILAPISGILSSVIPLAANNTTNASAASAGLGMITGLGAIFLIIGLPILVFIFSFIGHVLFAFFYNVLIPRVGGIKLDLAAVNGNIHAINGIPPIPAALAIAMVFLIFGLIQGILNFISLASMGDVTGGIINLIGNIIGSFVGYFIITAIVAVLYNFLAPKIGAIKLELE